MAWNPEKYLEFEEERFAPFEDLVALIRVREGLSVIDLGCGTGELTRRLADRLPGSTVLGIDASAEMLQRASQWERPGLSFARQTVGETTGRWDLVFSHAVLHWIEDHPSLIPSLLDLLGPGGQLALQLPANHRHPSQTLIVETAQEEPFKTALSGWVRRSPVLEIDRYAEILHDAGAVDITVLEKVYPHLLPDSGAVADWTAGTTLIPYYERLPRDLHDPFMARYREKLGQVWATTPVFFTFRRIIMAATRAA
ncbi:methyltransferase [Geobacter sp. DSM 9736]|uniref:methyltransferase n=1 Tax=Geobacter sp. DSM 9736 TaxID=1277350 RepID=UPI000B4FD8E4|nr:methyltransferase [Geobacter sp. DSM 9736]SNB46124.1 trans-aconitate 2-methyltransferase [Geobacter sp. DSM 9736]